MSGAAFRFSAELKSKGLYLKSVNTYIRAMTEYNSNIWHQNRKTIEVELEKQQRVATRYSIQSTEEDHVTYEQRRL